mmetsp:Transcript_33987/g.109127  ORF Transcript_33987/g.109127 Transcript_33987/m.109127 type:complete len:247 (-) Transcript_33987:1216-1956(-)
MTVRPLEAPSIASCTSRSDSESRADVASSSSSTRGSASRARAMATRCFCPPDSLTPRSPTSVAYLSEGSGKAQGRLQQMPRCSPGTAPPVREAAHKLVRVGAAARLLYARADGGVVKVDPPPAFARARRGQGVADVLLDGETEEERLLLHQRHLGPQPHLVEIPHAVAVDRDRASLRVVEAQQQRESCALAAAARPDQRDRRLGLHRQSEATQHGDVLCRREGEHDALEGDLAAHRLCRRLPAAGW